MRTSAWIGSLAIVAAACGGPVTDATSAAETTGAVDAATTTSIVLEEQEIPRHLQPFTRVWNTDFSKATVPLEELLVGIPASDPRDLIPPIDEPVFDTVGESEWLVAQDPGIRLEIDGDARFYPLSILTRHEIVNDVIGGMPVVVSYCPLCNTALAFDRNHGGSTLRFGVSGLLRKSDLVMWDDKTESLWQQVTGEAIVGELAGETLTAIPSAIVRFADFAANHPGGMVLSNNQRFGINYGVNPYVGYSSRGAPYGFFTDEIDDRYPAMERVIGVSASGEDKAYPFSEIAEVRAVNDVLGGTPIVVFWGAPDTADALDRADISASRGVGTGVAYSSTVGGDTLTFRHEGGDLFTDAETGTRWNILGVAVDGPLAGESLELVTHRNEFWFAWQAFFPEAEVWSG